jgi:hypothetical protein
LILPEKASHDRTTCGTAAGTSVIELNTRDMFSILHCKLDALKADEHGDGDGDGDGDEVFECSLYGEGYGSI